MSDFRAPPASARQPTKDGARARNEGADKFLQGDYAEAVSHFEQGNLDNRYTKYHLALVHEGAGNTRYTGQFANLPHEEAPFSITASLSSTLSRGPCLSPLNRVSASTQI